MEPTSDEDAHEVRVWRLPPEDQALFIGVFSMFYFGGTPLVLLIFDRRDLIPPWWFFLVLLVLYAVCWLSFYSRSDLHQIIGKLNPYSRDRGNPILVGRTARALDETWPMRDAARIVLLSFGVVGMTAWFTMYSGGPIRSPFGQYLLALPLLAPNIATRARSIASIYAATVLAFLGANTLELPRCRDQMNLCQLPDVWWYGTTAFVLLISGALAYGTRDQDERGDAVGPHSAESSDESEGAGPPDSPG